MLFSMDDISFDDNNNVVEKSIEDFNKAVLKGLTEYQENDENSSCS